MCVCLFVDQNYFFLFLFFLKDYVISSHKHASERKTFALSHRQTQMYFLSFITAQLSNSNFNDYKESEYNQKRENVYSFLRNNYSLFYCYYYLHKLFVFFKRRFAMGA